MAGTGDGGRGGETGEGEEATQSPWALRGGAGRTGVCNSNGQIVIAERFDRWIMTSNDTPRWESKPPLIPPRARRARVSPQPRPRLPPPPPPPFPRRHRARESISSPCAASTAAAARAEGGGRRGRVCGYEIASCICSLHLASDYARPITAVKLDCRRLSPADRPNKTRIFSGITAVPAAFLPPSHSSLPPSLPLDRPTDRPTAGTPYRPRG
jgi:hypothetical protein